MPIHLSIGFTLDDSPRKAYVAECGIANVESHVSGIWSREKGCGMGVNCSCGGCISRGAICVPRGDDRRVIFSVKDSDGDEYDISGASEIVFIIAEGLNMSGNVYPGGSVIVEKRLTTGGIVLAGTGYQFVVLLDTVDTADLPAMRMYYEARITSAGGEQYTISNGLFLSQDTMIKDI